jgi:hypothetical protein
MAQPPSAPNPNQFPSYYPEPKYQAPEPVPSSGSWQGAHGNGNALPKQEDSRGIKRQWGRVFNNAHVEGSMQNGSRPSTNSAAYGSDPTFSQTATDLDEDGYDLGKLKMSYRRADGVEIVRRLPGED